MVCRKPRLYQNTLVSDGLGDSTNLCLPEITLALVLTGAAAAVIGCRSSGLKGIGRNDLWGRYAPLRVAVVQLDVEASVIVHPADDAAVVTLCFLSFELKVECMPVVLTESLYGGSRNYHSLNTARTISAPNKVDVIISTPFLANPVPTPL